MAIANPAAGRPGRRRRIDRVRDALASLGPVDWRETSGPGTASDLAASVAREGGCMVVACGGDGTVHEVVAGLARLPPGDRPVLGVVPAGTGNDFAFAMGIPKNLAGAVRLLADGIPRLVDLGTIEGDGRRGVWINSAGLMFDAAVKARSLRYGRGWGNVKYLLAAVTSILRDADPVVVRLSVDGAAPVETSLLMLTAGNGPREGGAFLTTPDARNDDGLLDLLRVGPVPRRRLFGLLGRVRRGLQAEVAGVTLGRFRSLHLVAERPVPVHLDGEIWTPPGRGVQEVRIGIEPGALRAIGSC